MTKEVRLLFDELPILNKMFINEIKRIIIKENQKEENTTENFAYVFLQNFYRVPGIPFGYYVASDGICLFGPQYQENEEVKIVYNNQLYWENLEESVPAFKKYVKDKKINYHLLNYKDNQQNFKWAYNEQLLINILNNISVLFGLIMYYQSQNLPYSEYIKIISNDLNKLDIII